MEKVDKTKENIGVSDLDDKTRKKLFDKFVDGGGEIVDERAKKRQLVIDREKQKQYLNKIDTHKKNIKKTQKQAPQKKPSPSKTNYNKEMDTMLNFFSKLKLKFKLRFLKVTNFSGYYFNLKFLEKFNNTYKPALMELQIIYLELFKKNPSTAKRIIDRLDNMKPLYYELIDMVGNVYDKIFTDQIIDHYINFPDVPHKVSELKEPLMSLYKKLYVLFQYDNSIMNAFENAINLHMKIEEEKHSYYSSLRKKIRSSIFISFHKLYPRLHLLFCLYYGKNVDFYSTEIEKILSIEESDKPGNRLVKKLNDEVTPVETEEEPDTTQKANDDTKDPKSRAIKKGLQLMYDLDLKALRKEFDKEGRFDTVSDDDKILLAYILFEEFDKEYSFILTTNKVKYNIDFGDRAKTDFKARLGDLYNQMKKSSDSLSKFTEELAIYEKARREKPPDSSKYIEYTKRLENLEKKKNNHGKNSLLLIKNFMQKVSGELTILIEDMDTAQKHIENPQDILEFDPLIEGDKKVNGKKIYEAVHHVFSYAMAFIYRLESGDLSGAGGTDVKGDTPQKGQKEEQKKSEPPEESLEPQSASDSSILEELDDML